LKQKLSAESSRLYCTAFEKVGLLDGIGLAEAEAEEEICRKVTEMEETGRNQKCQMQRLRDISMRCSKK